MRYILFNLAVGAALIYLFNGGQLPAMDWKAGIAQLKAEVTANDPAPVPAPKQLAAAGQSHGRDVIEAPKPAPKPQPKPEPSTGSTKSKAAPQLPPMPEAQQVAKRPEPKPAPKGVQTAAAASTPSVPPVPPAVAQRRAEVLGEAAPAPAPKRVRLEPGTTMMSSADRKRELDALAEEMEMLYIQKIGG